MKDKFEKILVGIACVPIFFGDNFLIISSAPSSNFAVPISILVLSILILIKFLDGRIYINVLDVHVVVILMYMSISYFFIGFLLYNSPPSFLLLYSVPMLIGYAAGRLSQLELSSFVNTYVFAMAGYAFLHLICSVYEFGLFDAIKNQGSDAVFNIFFIYGKYIYYPLMLSLALFFISSGVLKELDKFKYLLGFIIVCELIILASRESFLIAFLMYVGYKIRVGELRKIMHLFGCAIICITVLMAIGEDVPLVEKILNLGGNPSAGRLDQVLHFMD